MISQIVRAVFSSIFHLTLQFLIFLLVYVVAIIISPYGLISSIVAVIPLALAAVMTISGALFTLYIVIITPILQFIISLKIKDNSPLDEKARWKSSKIMYFLTYFNASILSIVVLNYIL